MPLAARRSLASLTASLAMVGAAVAGENADRPPAAIEALRLSGYGTLARTWDDSRDLAPIRDISQRPRNSFATGPTWRLDSRLGVQVAYRLSPSVEGVGQAVLRDQETAGGTNAIELAYLQVAPRPDLRLRAGRIGYDAFLMSDHRNLGYAYTWVRPPTEFYGWVPIFSVDGADVTRDFDDGADRWRIKAQAGTSRTSIPVGDGPYDFGTDYLWSATVAREQGPWRLKAGWSQFRIGREATQLSALRDGLDQVAHAGVPGISGEAARLRVDSRFDGVRYTYGTVGVAYDDGRWFVQAEYSRSRSTTAIAPASDMRYVAAGRRFGPWSPFAILAASHPTRDAMQPESDWNSIGQGTLQQQAYFVLNSTRIAQETASAGVRWDAHPNVALKFQWDHTEIHARGYGLWFRSPASNSRSEKLDLVTLSADFVF